MIPNNKGKIEDQNSLGSPPKNLIDLQTQGNFQ